MSDNNDVIHVSVESDNFSVLSGDEISVVSIGHVGPPGAMGPAGETGPQGPQGPQGIQGESADHGSLSGLSDDDHGHYALADGTRGNFASTSHSHDTSDVSYDESLTVGSPIQVTSIQDAVNLQWSSGIISGCEITDNVDGTVSISSGEASIRASSDPSSDIYIVSTPPAVNLSIADDVTSYIYLDWNSGSPVFVVGTSTSSFNCLDKCVAYVVHRYGTLMHIIDARGQNVDSNRKIRRMFMEYSRFIHADGGSIIGASGLSLTVSQGKFFFMISEQAHDSFDTSVAGSGNQNVFNLWSMDGSGGWTRSASQKAINTNLYDSGTGTLSSIGDGKYGVSWVYILHDSPSTLEVVVGQQQYDSAADAIASARPSNLPSMVTGVGSLIGKVAYQKGATSFSNVISYLEYNASGSSITSHNSLSDIQGGSTGDYQHLTAAQVSNINTLSGGGDTSLHTHSSSYDPIGSASSAVSSHELATDPHGQYAKSSDLSSHSGNTSNPHSVTASQLSDFAEAVDDRVSSLLVAGANVTLTYDDSANTLTVAAASGGSSDHGSLSGLSDDDHSQYHTDSRGDARYSQLAHTHTGVYEPANANIQSHISNTSNPHSVTAAQVGLGSAENKTFASGIADATHLATAKATPVDDDEVPISDSAASWSIKKLSWSSIKTTLKSYFDTIYSLSSHTHTGVYEPANANIQSHISNTSNPHSVSASQLSDFSEAVDDRVSSLLVAGANVTLTYDDSANTLTVASSGGGDTVSSGRWTPTCTNLSNTSAITPQSCIYNRIDNIITVSGSVAIDPVATGATSITITLPVARGSNFSSEYDAAGTLIGRLGNILDLGQVYATVGSEELTLAFNAANTSSKMFRFSAQYRLA